MTEYGSQQLVLEIYKVTKGLAPTAISSLFLQFSNNRRTISQSNSSVPQVNIVYFDLNSMRYLGPLIWNSIPTASRNVKSSVEFKSLIKNWKPSKLPLQVRQRLYPSSSFFKCKLVNNIK